MRRSTKLMLSLSGILLLLGFALWAVGAAGGGRAQLRERYREDLGWISSYVTSDGVQVGGSGGIHVGPDGVHIGGEDGLHVTASGVDIGGGDGIHVGPHSGTGGSGNRQTVKETGLTGVTSVEVEIDYGDIRIREGESFDLSLDWNIEKYAMRYQVEKGTLKIESEKWGNISGLDTDCTVTLTIPAGTALDELDLLTAMGDVKVEAAITALEADLSTNLGNVVCRELQAGELEAESDLGDVSVILPAACKDVSYVLSTGLGEVRVNGETRKNPVTVIRSGQGCYLEASSSLGDVSLEYTE